MSWLHSSLARHQQITESGRSNLRKGYKVASSDKDDPDNSDTPLLHDSSSSANQRVMNSDWFANAPPTSKSQITSKTGFSTSFFNKSVNNSASKNQTASNTSGVITQQNKISEDKTLLNTEQKKGMFGEEDFDSDSEDEWGLPMNGGYQKVRSGAD